MRKLHALIIVGFMLAAAYGPASAAPSPSDWPSLNADAAQSNSNPTEKTLTARNILKLRVRWTAPDSALAYPIIAGGRVYLPRVSGHAVHVRVLDAQTGKQLAVMARNATGGMVYADGNVYLAGHVLQEVDPATGGLVAQAHALPATSNGTFLYPLADHKIVLAGYYAGSGRQATSSLYAFSPDMSRALWKAPSLRAQGTIGQNRILTDVTAGASIHDETSGRRIALQRSLHSDWFSGRLFNYTVATVKQGNETLYAFDGAGHRAWSIVVGPRLLVQRWPHAVGSSGLYVSTLRPQGGLASFDPELGTVQWRQSIPNIQRLALANGVLYALTYSLGQPVRLVLMHADTGKVIGAIVLASGYYAFASQNELMVANGMVYIRATGPTGPVLLALGL
ncbi:MAG: hypothetical protein NVS4B2_10110 [Chloroflexota bacterium]